MGIVWCIIKPCHQGILKRDTPIGFGGIHAAGLKQFLNGISPVDRHYLGAPGVIWCVETAKLIWVFKSANCRIQGPARTLRW